jgi:hypothetical protein
MATPNIRGAYELLRRAMQQYDPQQQGADFGETPNAAPQDSSESYGSPQGGLLGRLLSLQAEQGQYQPLAGSNGQTPTDWQTPDAGQAPRARLVVRPHRAPGAYDPPDGESEPDYSPYGTDLAAQPNEPIANASVPAVRLVSRNGTLSPTPQNSPAFANDTAGLAGDPMQAAPLARTGLLGAYSDGPLPAWMAPSARIMTAPMGWRVGGIPIPPMMPMPLPQMPPLAIPDAWKTAWKILQFYPWILSRLRGDGGGPEGLDIQNSTRGLPQGNEGLSTTYAERSVTPSIENMSTMRTDPPGLQSGGAPVSPVGPMPLPPIPRPRFPDWSNPLWKPLQLDGTNYPGGGGRGGGDTYRRCMQAAQQSTLQWENFCRTLPSKKSKALCWSQASLPQTDRETWCKNMFGSK